MSWNADDALTVPIASLLCSGKDRALSAIRHRNAPVQIIKIGQRNNREAEVPSGLKNGDRVVLHPSDRINDADSAKQREVQ